MLTEERGPYRVLSSREVYRNPWIRVREDKVLRPNGGDGAFGVIEMRAGSSVLALTENEEVYLVREFKYGIGAESIETMSGALEAEESPLDAARRELREELGLEASEWVSLGLVNPFTTVVHSPNHMFLALGLHSVQACRDEEEVLEAVKVSFTEALNMVMDGQITHSASCVLILKAERYLRGRNSAEDV